jgi:HAMP domain-containing protein
MGHLLWAVLAAAVGVAQAPSTDPLIRENAVSKVSEHVHVISDLNVGLVPNVGIIVGTRATLVVDTGLGPRNGETVRRVTERVSTNRDLYVVSTHFHPEHALGESAFRWILAVLTLTGLLCIVVGWAIIRSVSVPITAMTAAMRRLAGRDMDAAIVGIGRGDEIGGMAGAVQVFRDGMIEADRLAAEQAGEQAAKERRAARLTDIVRSFEAKIEQLGGHVADNRRRIEIRRAVENRNVRNGDAPGARCVSLPGSEAIRTWFHVFEQEKAGGIGRCQDVVGGLAENLFDDCSSLRVRRLAHNRQPRRILLGNRKERNRRFRDRSASASCEAAH